jgi:serine/threonine-protein kinase RsbW
MTESPRPDAPASEHRLEVGTAIPELRRISAWLHGLLGDGLAADALFSLDLGRQEAVANVISHGFPEGAARGIVVTLRRWDERIEVEVEDDGIPFDPLGFQPPPLPERLEDATLGGNGIRLMRRFLDEISYRRSSDRNHLVMTRRLPGGRRP